MELPAIFGADCASRVNIMISRSNFFVHLGYWADNHLSVHCSTGLGYTLVPQDTNYLKYDLRGGGGILSRAPRKQRLDGKGQLTLQHRRPVRYRLDHGGQLITMVILRYVLYTCTLCYTHPYVRPLLHWTGVYPGTP